MGFHFNIIKSNRIKNPLIRCNKDCIFTFCFPRKYSDKNTLNEAKRYIENNQCKMDQMQKLQSKKSMNAMQYIEQNPNVLLFFDTKLHVETLDIESLMQKFHTKAKKLLDECAEIMQLSYKTLTISHKKSYLGQCDRFANIKIDYRNLLTPEILLRYLIVHELSHIRHPNHSKNFWNEVATFYPNYKKARKELREMADRNAIILRHYGLLPQSLL